MMKFFLLLCLVGYAVADERQAIVFILGQSTGIKGNVTFTESGNSVRIVGLIEGLPPGVHGFHVHEKGDISSCDNAKGHFNPSNKSHGAPTDEERHVGDLGNIDANDHGVASFNLTDNVIALSGTNNIIGRAVVIHANRDDLGKGNFPDSNTTGHAGSRIACGVVGILSPVTPWEISHAETMSMLPLSVLTIIVATMHMF